MDIALMQLSKNQSTILRRYVPTHLGSTQINLRPEIAPGAYSLLLTVYKGRTSTVLSRSLVSKLFVVEESQQVDSDTHPPSESVIKNPINTVELLRELKQDKGAGAEDQFHFRKEFQDVILDDEPLQLVHESGGEALVMMSPYTIGWSVPKIFEKVPQTKVNILLVSNEDGSEDSTKAEVQRVLAANLDARTGFYIVILPRDIPRRDHYQVRVEIYGNGRKVVGYTHRFSTVLPVYETES
ncbi:hypothetical protein BGZ54_005947 [Gamsiella multidivaricata]|nr:hypothetical protein BGZ54_005947 [Gamsiella multidivaricata]